MASLSNEVDDNEVQNKVGEDEVGKGALGRDVRELRLVFGIDLDAEWYYRQDCETTMDDNIKI